MPTTSQQLDDFATLCEGATVWTLDLQGQLMDLIREPALTLLDQTIPPLNRNSAMDNIYRCKPKGWIRAEQELMPKSDGTSQGSVASFALWDVRLMGDSLKNFGLVGEIGIKKPCATLALAMIAATARLWAFLLTQAGR